MSIFFPPGTPPDEIERVSIGMQQRDAQQGMLYNTLGQMGQMVTDTFRPQMAAPALDPVAAAAMTPQMYGQTVQMQQQDRQHQEQMQLQQVQMQERNRIDQERMRLQTKKEIQQAQDQRDRLRLQQMNYDNQQADREFRRKQQEAAQKQKENEAKAKAAQPQLHMPSGQQFVMGDGGWSASPVAGYRAPAVGGGGGGVGAGTGVQNISAADELMMRFFGTVSNREGYAPSAADIVETRALAELVSVGNYAELERLAQEEEAARATEPSKDKPPGPIGRFLNWWRGEESSAPAPVPVVAPPPGAAPPTPEELEQMTPEQIQTLKGLGLIN